MRLLDDFGESQALFDFVETFFGPGLKAYHVPPEAMKIVAKADEPLLEIRGILAYGKNMAAHGAEIFGDKVWLLFVHGAMIRNINGYLHNYIWFDGANALVH